MSKTREYYSQDITWCASGCDDTKCFRHPSHIMNRTIPHSFAYFEGTEDCYKYESESKLACKGCGFIVVSSDYKFCPKCGRRLS